MRDLKIMLRFELMKQNFLYVAVVVLLSTFNASASQKPLALVYKGQGACDHTDTDWGYSCSDSAATTAQEAGFDYKFVGPKDLPDFSKAKIWIQPGGVSNTAYYAMSNQLKSALVKFVKDGGGFVGFCAGAFLATDWFHFIDADSALYRYNPIRPDLHYALLNIDWYNQRRVIFFSGGPYFYKIGPSVEVTARFSTGYAASIRAAYGKGRVYVTGPHPEAPPIWTEEDNITDPDGSDRDLAAGMMHWAAGFTNN